jgi:tripartite-type tricarboxylate transporter receptor subunit TctC
MGNGLARRAVSIGLGALGTAALARRAGAQSYPARPLRIVVPYAAGGGADACARAFYARLGERLGQAIVIENRGGGGGTIGALAVARAANDGYTLLHDTNAFAMNQFLLSSMPFDATRDFAPIILVARVPTILAVHPSVPARTVPEFIDWVKASPGGVECASAGNGTPMHLGLELFSRRSGARLNHVPYRGGAPAVNDLIGGQIKAGVIEGAVSIGFLQSGALRGLAHNGHGRLPSLPDLPAMDEFIPGFEAVTWHALLAPAGTSPAIVAQLNAGMNAVMRDQDFVARLAAVNTTVAGGSPQELGAFLAEDARRWGPIIREAGITAG